jgi:hypothetical protein
MLASAGADGSAGVSFTINSSQDGGKRKLIAKLGQKAGAASGLALQGVSRGNGCRHAGFHRRRGRRVLHASGHLPTRSVAPACWHAMELTR